MLLSLIWAFGDCCDELDGCDDCCCDANDHGFCPVSCRDADFRQKVLKVRSGVSNFLTSHRLGVSEAELFEHVFEHGMVPETEWQTWPAKIRFLFRGEDGVEEMDRKGAPVCFGWRAGKSGRYASEERRVSGSGWRWNWSGVRIVGPNGRDQTCTPGGDPAFRKGAGVQVPELEVLVRGCASKKSLGQVMV